MDSPGLLRWEEAIKIHEGWAPGTRSYRNNNPGNFRYTPLARSLGATGRDPQNFASFPNAQVGTNALLQFLRYAQQNQLIAYRLHARDKGRPGNMCTLADFYEVYAPSYDANNPSAYAKWVAQFIGNGVTVGTPLNQI